MTSPPPGRRFGGIIAALIVFICAVDLIPSLPGAVAVLYICPIILASRSSRSILLSVGILCIALTVLVFLWQHAWHMESDAFLRFLVSLTAIICTTLLCLRHHHATLSLAEQARILDVTHDTVIIRDADDIIRYWNQGAASFYGYSAAEALGRKSAELLKTEAPEAKIARAMEAQGAWSGYLRRTRGNGTFCLADGRWLARRDEYGRLAGIIETSVDLTEQSRSGDGFRLAENRYAAIFHARAFAAWDVDWSGAADCLARYRTAEGAVPAIPDDHPAIVQEIASRVIVRSVNLACVRMFDAESEAELISQQTVGRYAPSSEEALGMVLIALADGATSIEQEISFRTLKERIVDVVLRITILPSEVPFQRVLITALNVTERNQACARLERVSAELTHAARVAMLGQLTSTISHEVSKPLAAIVSCGLKGRRQLVAMPAQRDEALACLDEILANGSTAAAVVERVRRLARKSPPEYGSVNLSDLIQDTLKLLHHEARACSARIDMEKTSLIVYVWADRIQLQRVLVNLLMNAIQAVAECQSRQRIITILLENETDNAARVEVRDTGPGLPSDAATLFRPFYTTRTDGIGMGLPICRSVVEMHGGTIAARNHPDGGAAFSFTLPQFLQLH